MQLSNLGIRLGFPNRGKNETIDGQRMILSLGDSISRGNSSAVGSTPTLGTVKAWDDGGNTTYDVTNTDLLEPVAASAIGSQWPRFGITYNALTGKIPVICNCGIGGTRWFSNTAAVSWETSGDLWPDALAKANNCLNFLGLDAPWAVYINMGINDASQDSYTLAYSHITHLINRVNTAWNFPRIFVVLIGRPNETSYSNFSRIYQINKYIKQLSQDYANVELCTSSRSLVAWGGNFQGDDYHLNFTGNELHGTMVARQMALPTSWAKYTRFCAGLHYDQISNTRIGYINNDLVLPLGNSIYEYDELRFFSDCAADDRNAVVDFAGLSPAVLVATPGVSYDGITTNGTSQYISVGVRSLTYNKSSESDFITGVFMGTVSSAAGGSDRAAFGVRESASGGITLLNQRSTSQIGVLAASTSGTLYSSETKFANDSFYALYRNSGDHNLVKNTTPDTPATVTQVAHGATLLRGEAIGAYNNNTTVQQFLAAVFKAKITRKYTTMNLSTEVGAINSFLANWMTNIT